MNEHIYRAICAVLIAIAAALFGVALINAAFADPVSPPTPTVSGLYTIPSSRVMAAFTATKILTITCQRGTVSFDMGTGKTEYHDCTPDEGARNLFKAFEGQIKRACLIKIEEKP